MIPIPVLGKRWRVSDLFKRRQGAWLEPRAGYMWQEHTGVTPTTTGGQTIGLLLDQSQGAVLGPELVTTPYSGSTSGTWAISSTSITRNSSATGQASSSLSISVDTTKRYLVSFTVANLSGDTFFYRIGGGGTAYQITSNGVYTARVLGGSTASSIIFAPWAGSAGEATITNISVRQILGNHASQATAANRPILQFTGNLPLIRSDANDSLVASLPALNVRRNLLTYSEQFDNAAWVKNNLSVVLDQTGYKLKENSITTVHQVYQGVTLTASIYTLSFYAKAAERSVLAFTFDTTGNSWGNINLTNGSIVDVMPADYTVNFVSSVGDGWYRISVSRTASVATYYTNFATAKGSSVVYAGDGTSGIYLRNVQLELGSVATDYQKITDWTSEQYSSAGSVYFGVPQGMSALHNQSIGTNYTLPAVNSEIYGWVVVPERLTRPEEAQLERYFLKRAGISGGPDYLLDNNDQQLTDDSDELLLRA